MINKVVTAWTLTVFMGILYVLYRDRLSLENESALKRPSIGFVRAILFRFSYLRRQRRQSCKFVHAYVVLPGCLGLYGNI